MSDPVAPLSLSLAAAEPERLADAVADPDPELEEDVMAADERFPLAVELAKVELEPAEVTTGTTALVMREDEEEDDDDDVDVEEDAMAEEEPVLLLTISNHGE